MNNTNNADDEKIRICGMDSFSGKVHIVSSLW